MRPLICYIATSLDGYIAGPNGEIDWLFTDQDYGYKDFFAGIDTVVMGRKTYDLCLSFPEYPYPNIPHYVWSRTHRNSKGNVTFLSGDAAEWLGELKLRSGKAIWLVGGSALVGEATAHDLLDELIISVHPIVLGDGISLFRRDLPRRSFQFVQAQSFTSGLVQLTYRRTT